MKRRNRREAVSETSGRRQSENTDDSGRLAEIDHLIEVRERLVTILDAINQDDVDTARFYAAGLLEDFDRAADDEVLP